MLKDDFLARRNTATSETRSPAKLPARGTSTQFLDVSAPLLNALPANQAGTTLRPLFSSKCRCAPEALPLSPRVPIIAPWSTRWPTATTTLARWA